MAANLLFTYARTGQLDKIKELVQSGADIRQAGKQGYTALHTASEHGHTEIISYLVNAGLDPDARTKDLESILHIAAEHDQLAVMRLALSLGLSPNATDTSGYPPLYRAVTNRNYEACTILLNGGADVNLVANSQKRPLLLQAITNDDLALVQLLIEHGADVNSCDDWQDTMLHWAGKYSSVAVIEYLLNHGASIAAKSHSGNTVLLAFAERNNVGGAQLLLERGVDINEANEYGCTPLMHAIRMRNKEFVAFLLEHGADICSTDIKNRSAFVYADQTGNEEIIALLKAEDDRRGNPSAEANLAKTARELILQYLEQQKNQKKIVLDLDRLVSGITEIPAEIGDSPAIVRINANNTKITTFPPSIGKLKNLRKLSAVNTKLQTLPDEFGALENLREFIAFASRLETLPQSIGKLKNLKVMDVCGNKLSTLPDTIAHLENLTELDLADNAFRTIPASVFALKNLRTLKLQDNDLTSIPDSFLNLSALKRITLSNNPHLCDPPYEIAKKGVAAIREYIEARRSAEPMPGPEAPGCPAQEEEYPAQPQHISQLESQIEKYVGKISSVWHELISDEIHIDIFVVKAQGRRKFHSLITSGLSAKPMQIPEGAEAYRFAELMLCLPKDWPLAERDFEEEANYWPIRLLKKTIRYIHAANTWLAPGHTLENSTPYAGNTAFCGALIARPIRFPAAFSSMRLAKDDYLHIYSMIPLYQEEIAYKLDNGLEALVNRLSAANIDEVVDINRPNTAPG